MTGYYAVILYRRGDECLTIGAVLLVPEAGVVETMMVRDVARVAAAFATTITHVREVQAAAAMAIERDVHRGADLCAARIRWCHEVSITDTRWCRVVGEPQETLRHILEGPSC